MNGSDTNAHEPTESGAQDAPSKGSLKPCPFCGSPAELEEDSDHHGGWFNLGCSKHWGKSGIEPENACPGGRIWYTEDPEGKSRAIQSWNTRADTAAPELLALLREAADLQAGLYGDGTALHMAMIGWVGKARAAIAKAEGRS
jgi:hypothetical protein